MGISETATPENIAVACNTNTLPVYSIGTRQRGFAVNRTLLVLQLNKRVFGPRRRLLIKY